MAGRNKLGKTDRNEMIRRSESPREPREQTGTKTNLDGRDENRRAVVASNEATGEALKETPDIINREGCKTDKTNGSSPVREEPREIKQNPKEK